MAGEGTYICHLDDETQAKALRELRENPRQRASQIEALRSWVKSQPHITTRTGASITETSVDSSICAERKACHLCIMN